MTEKREQNQIKKELSEDETSKIRKKRNRRTSRSR